MKKYTTFLLMIIVSSLFSQTTLRLGTSTVGGNYNKLGKIIQSILEKDIKEISTEIVVTEGSVDNIFKLLKKEIDVAIVQNDIAFLAENGLDPFNEKFDKLRGLITFHTEPIYIISNNYNIRSINHLATYKINVGPERSGLLTDAKIILESLDLYDLIRPVHYKPAEVIDLLRNNVIQASFINNLDSNYLSEIVNNRLIIVPLGNELISSLMRTYSYFDEFNSMVNNELVATISVKAILLCRADLDTETAYTLTKHIYNNYHHLEIPNVNLNLSKSEATTQMPLKHWHKGSFRFFNEIGILKSQVYLEYLWLVLFIPIAIVLSIIILNFLFITIHKKYPILISVNSLFLKFIKRFNILFSRYKYMMIILVVVTALLSNIIIVQRVEHNWAIKNNKTSNFDNNSFSRNLIWLFVFGGCGYNDNIFPNSPIGKLLVTLIPLIGIGGVMSIIGIATSDHIKRKILEARGVQIKMVKDHIILCGWNENVPFLIKNMLHENIAHKKPIVLLADINEERPLEKYEINDKLVSYIKGDATNKNDLKRANLKEADIAIIVADSNSSDQDAKSILKILTIEKYCLELEENGLRKNRENIYTIAELYDANKFELAYDAYVDEVILLGQIQSKILVQSVLNPGVSKFINEILTYNEFNDIYSILVEKESNLLGLTFDDLLINFRKYNILLLSIYINSQDKDVVKKYNIKRHVITNPIEEAEINYHTRIGDRLIVLAQYEKVVDDAVKEIEKLKTLLPISQEAQS